MTSLWVSARFSFYHQCRWGASAQQREKTAATFSSWPGNAQPTAPAAESALMVLSCMGTSQTGSARPGHAQGETRHLPRGQKNPLIIYSTSTRQCFQAKNLFQMVSSRQTWTYHIGAERREIFRKLSLIQSLLNFILFLQDFKKGFGMSCVMFCSDNL